MNGIVKPDKDLERAFRKMVRNCAKKDGGRTSSYVDDTFKRMEDICKGSLPKLEEIDNDALKTY